MRPKNYLIIMLALVFSFGCVSNLKKQKVINVTLELSKTNVLYRGLNNPCLINVSGISCKSIELEGENCDITGDSCSYLIRPYKKADTVDIRLYHVKGESSEMMKTVSFKVDWVPDPIVTIGGKRSGDINADTLGSLDELNVEFTNSDFKMNWDVVGFEIVLEKSSGDIILQERIDEGRLTDLQKDYIKKMEVNDRIIFQNIFILKPNGKKAAVIPIVLKIT